MSHHSLHIGMVKLMKVQSECKLIMPSINTMPIIEQKIKMEYFQDKHNIENNIASRNKLNYLNHKINSHTIILFRIEVKELINESQLSLIYILRICIT